jgi:hypothetical protein
MVCQSNQPLLAGGLTSGIKQKPYLAVSYCLCGYCEAARWRQKTYKSAVVDVVRNWHQRWLLIGFWVPRHLTRKEHVKQDRFLESTYEYIGAENANKICWLKTTKEKAVQISSRRPRSSLFIFSQDSVFGFWLDLLPRGGIIDWLIEKRNGFLRYIFH